MLESEFGRSMSNLGKAGAYYTNLEECSKISNFFEWPEDEVAMLEPCAGDGKAILEVTKGCQQRKIFAVETNREVFEDKLENSKDIYQSICCDFLSTKITNSVFSFCFCNPPYIRDEVRMEEAFLKRIKNYMSPEGIIVYIVPYSVVSTVDFQNVFQKSFKLLHAYKFSEKEYKKFHQIVLIGKRCNSDNLVSWKMDFEEIPEKWTGEKIKILPSKENKVKSFTSQVFDVISAEKNLVREEPQQRNLLKIGISAYQGESVGKPPVMPNTNTLYLLSTLGVGSGKVGCSENMDEHLQRGCTSVEKTTYEEMDPESCEVYEVTRKSTKVTVTVIENDGTISHLE
jgi:16S rRNA G966 N2-methylase RsmD